MRDCRRSDELRNALAAEEHLAPGLAAHVAACAECTRVAADAGRFESRLDAAMAVLVTDALPPGIAVVARTAPHGSRRWSSPRILAGAILAIALGAFAGIGVVTTGVSISDAILFGSGATQPPDEGDIDSVDCYIGDPVVDVVVEGDGGAALAGEVVVAYCFDGATAVPADGRYGVTCVRSVDGPGGAMAVRRAGSAPSGAPDDEAGYLSACTRVGDVSTPPDDPTDRGAVTLTPSAPFGSWDEARAAAAWTVLRPGWLPAGYDLATLQGFSPPTDPRDIDSVVATYLRRGTPLSIDQFVIADPDEFRIELTVLGNGLDRVTTGRTTVGGHAAFWADGVGIQTVGGPGAEVESIVLAWSDDRVGYRITARDADLEDLRRVAASFVED